ncbi:hypothetical protein ACIO14_05595 [Nocardia fluminea]|uniref:hypothetical protein n=1 Tax=Nocardia fluminea TaxID=134984 RepID=UPI0037F40264
MTTTEIVLAGVVASGAGGLWMWIRQDGLIRTAAALVAIFHQDPVRRRDARRVLGDAYLRGRAPEPARASTPRRSPRSPRGRRAAPQLAASQPADD